MPERPEDPPKEDVSEPEPPSDTSWVKLENVRSRNPFSKEEDER